MSERLDKADEIVTPMVGLGGEIAVEIIRFCLSGSFVYPDRKAGGVLFFG